MIAFAFADAIRLVIHDADGDGVALDAIMDEQAIECDEIDPTDIAMVHPYLFEGSTH